MRTIAEEFDAFRVACFPEAEGSRQADLEEAFFGGVASVLAIAGQTAAIPGWTDEMDRYQARRTSELERAALRNT